MVFHWGATLLRPPYNVSIKRLSSFWQVPICTTTINIPSTDAEAEKVGASSIAFYKVYFKLYDLSSVQFKGLLNTATSLNDLATKLGVPLENLKESMKDKQSDDIPFSYGFVTPVTKPVDFLLHQNPKTLQIYNPKNLKTLHPYNPKNLKNLQLYNPTNLNTLQPFENLHLCNRRFITQWVVSRQMLDRGLCAKMAR